MCLVNSPLLLSLRVFVVKDCTKILIDSPLCSVCMCVLVCCSNFIIFVESANGENEIEINLNEIACVNFPLLSLI
jgi:hypothetical protein